VSVEGAYKNPVGASLETRCVGLEGLAPDLGFCPQSLYLFFLCRGSIEGMAGGRNVRSLIHHYAFCLDGAEDSALKATSGSSFLMLRIQHQLIPSNYCLDRLHWQVSSCDNFLYRLCLERIKIESQPQFRSLLASVRCKIDQLILELLQSLVNASADAFSPLIYIANDGLGADDCIDSAMAYIDGRLNQSIKIEDLCQYIGLSPRAFQKLCKSRLGRSPRQLVQERRMIRLRALLEGRVPVSRACAEVGLKASGTTASLYRDMFGELPSHTMKKARFLGQL